jgi:hypothetical protein
MANHDQLVNGRKSELSLRKSGNVIITDAGRLTVWSTDTVSESSVFLYLHENGNLILQKSEGGVLWQSFDSPTDTLLPQQLLTKDMQLVSSRSQGNYFNFMSAGYGERVQRILKLDFDGNIRLYSRKYRMDK